MISYAWEFPTLVKSKALDGFTDVVTTVHWRRIADNGEGVSDIVYGTFDLAFDPAAPFVAFDDLTPEIVIAWAEAALPVSDIDAGLDGRIAALIDPPIVAVAPPWLAVPDDPA